MHDSSFNMDSVLTELITRIADAVAERVLPAVSTDSKNELIDEPAIAERLGVSRPTLQRLRKAGKAPFVRLGRRVMYDQSDVIAALRMAESVATDADESGSQVPVEEPIHVN